jgi:hypothetical protein
LKSLFIAIATEPTEEEIERAFNKQRAKQNSNPRQGISFPGRSKEVTGVEVHIFFC